MHRFILVLCLVSGWLGAADATPIQPSTPGTETRHDIGQMRFGSQPSPSRAPSPLSAQEAQRQRNLDQMLSRGTTRIRPAAPVVGIVAAAETATSVSDNPWVRAAVFIVVFILLAGIFDLLKQREARMLTASATVPAPITQPDSPAAVRFRAGQKTAAVYARWALIAIGVGCIIATIITAIVI